MYKRIALPSLFFPSFQKLNVPAVAFCGGGGGDGSGRGRSRPVLVCSIPTGEGRERESGENARLQSKGMALKIDI